MRTYLLYTHFYLVYTIYFPTLAVIHSFIVADFGIGLTGKFCRENVGSYLASYTEERQYQ